MTAGTTAITGATVIDTATKTMGTGTVIGPIKSMAVSMHGDTALDTNTGTTRTMRLGGVTGTGTGTGTGGDITAGTRAAVELAKGHKVLGRGVAIPASLMHKALDIPACRPNRMEACHKAAIGTESRLCRRCGARIERPIHRLGDGQYDHVVDDPHPGRAELMTEPCYRAAAQRPPRHYSPYG